MSVSYNPNLGVVPFRGRGGRWLRRGLPVTLPNLLYAVTLGPIVLGYYGYWALWQLKIYYFGWLIAFLAAPIFSLREGFDSKGLLRSLWPILVWEGYLAAAATWSPDPGTALRLVAAGAILPTAFVVGYIWMRNLSMWQLSSFFIVMGIIQLPIAFWDLLTIGELYDSNLGAVRTGLAVGLLFSIPFFVWRARNRPSRLNYFWIVLATLTLVATGSRSAPFIGILVLLGVFTFVQPPKRRPAKAFIKSILLTFPLLAGVAAIIPQVRTGASEAIDRLANQTAFDLRDWTNEDRFIIEEGVKPTDIERRVQMLVAVQSFYLHPIRGNGYFSTYTITGYYLAAPVGAHGLVPLFLGELGLIGFLVFAWLIFRFFRRTSLAIRKAETPAQKGFWQTCRWTMVAMLLFGLFHQVDQSPHLFVLLSWGFAAQFPA